jgi:hypothetical protein
VASTTPLIDHASLPAIATAPLPASYEAAKRALAQCVDLDECKNWADKAQALASYARQANDDALLKMSMRVQARAIDQCGALLKEIDPQPGARTDLQPSGGAPTRFGEAKKAGLSRDQAVTAIRVNNVPRDQFEEMVESDNPPTVTALGEIGTEHREPPDDYLKGRDPKDYEQATRLLGLFTWIEQRRGILDLEAALRGLNQQELQTVRFKLGVTLSWLSGLEEAIDGV